MKVLITDDYMRSTGIYPVEKKTILFFAGLKKKGFFPYILAKIR